MTLNVLVVTCAHRGNDARITQRQIRALLDAGHRVTYVAPAPTPLEHERFRHLEIPRAVGRRRLGAWRAVRRAALSQAADVMIVHDIEVLPLLAWHPCNARIWDVHEDFAAAASDRAWIHDRLKPVMRSLVRFVERAARSRYAFILAENLYQERLGSWPVVPNTTAVPETAAPYDPDEPRAVYVGRISRSRGVEEMMALGRRLHGRVLVELIGAADADCTADLEQAHERGDVVWHGFLPNDRALHRVEGALIGLSLLRDEANFRHSMPTKLIEYLARGVPVLSTPLPVAAELAAKVDGDVVPFGDTEAAAERVLGMLDDPGRRSELGRRGHAYVEANLNWRKDGPAFVELVENAAAFRTSAG